MTEYASYTRRLREWVFPNLEHDELLAWDSELDNARYLFDRARANIQLAKRLARFGGGYVEFLVESTFDAVDASVFDTLFSVLGPYRLEVERLVFTRALVGYVIGLAGVPVANLTLRQVDSNRCVLGLDLPETDVQPGEQTKAFLAVWDRFERAVADGSSADEMLEMTRSWRALQADLVARNVMLFVMEDFEFHRVKWAYQRSNLGREGQQPRRGAPRLEERDNVEQMRRKVEQFKRYRAQEKSVEVSAQLVGENPRTLARWAARLFSAEATNGNIR